MARALRVDKSVLVRNTPETLFKALTDRRELARWFADGASGDVREGAMIEFTWGAGPTARRSRASSCSRSRAAAVISSAK